MTTAGKFIVLEGGEGAGKSTVQRALAERLAGGGRDVVATREPGGTEFGEQVRAIVAGRDAVDDALAELLLFEAARAHLVASVIRPALERGAVVLCDRYAASSIAYQSHGRGVPRATVDAVNAIATGGLAADVTLLLDVPVEVGLRRRAGGERNHFDDESSAFHERVRAGFLDLARESPETWRVIDASRPVEDVVEAAYRAVAALP